MERISVDEIGGFWARKGILSGSNSFSKDAEASPPSLLLIPTVQVEAAEGPGRAGAAMIGPDGG